MGESETGEVQHSQENKIYRWEYKNHFRDYLNRLGFVGDKFECESIHNFPERIELDSQWYDLLDYMREKSRDGRERGIYFGLREGDDRIYFPDEVIRGPYIHKFVPNVSSLQLEERYGIVSLIGSIHSHPGDRITKFFDKSILFTRMAQDLAGFSAGDLYIMVAGNGLPIEAVIEQNGNYFAFRTRETEDIMGDRHSQKVFAQHWERKYGGLFVGNTMVGCLPSYSVQKMNVGIAENYNLALYKGRPDEDLVRVYPR